MTSDEVRQKFLDFFEKRGHKIIPSASLVPENDPTTLFTSSGMQQLVPYLKGQPHPLGKRLANSQPCFRTEDISEVGNNRHTTFFEMLGNWSLGDYWKKEQLAWIWEFLTKELNLPKEKLHVTLFEGNNQIPKDSKSEEMWKSLGVISDHIHLYGPETNWWSRSGTPDKMPPGEIGGPDSEIFYEFTQVKHDKSFGEACHPNCQCGRFLEIGNSVFIQYKKNAEGKLEELPQKNVDFGGGLERLTAAFNNNPDIFQTDLYQPIIKNIEEYIGEKYTDSDNKTIIRIIADHIKAATFIIAHGIVPSNKGQGYVLRRLLRRIMVKDSQLKDERTSNIKLGDFAETVLKLYHGLFGISYEQRFKVNKVITEEMSRFIKTLNRGLREVEKIEKIDGKKAFDLYQTFGFPYEVSEELFRQKGQEIDREQFKKEFEKHQELSRTASLGMFKGGLGEQNEQTTKYHTATHLLHAALRQILGDHVEQRGSNITSERLRFDFSHPQKLTEEQLQTVEDQVNQKIKEDLPVSSQVLTKEEALKSGALGFFAQKYGDQVTVHTIGNPSTGSGSPFSREICGGPHVFSTGELDNFKITKEESAGAGIRRVYATLS